MLRRTVIATAVPLVLQTLRNLVDIVDLVDRHALIREVQHLVVHVGVEIALAAEHFLNPVVAPTRPVMRGEHHLGLQAEAVERLADVLRPVQRIADRGAPQRVNVVQRRDDVLRHPQRLHIGNVGVHLPGRFGVRRVLKDHPDAVDLELLDVLFDIPVWRNQPDGAGRHGLAEALADITVWTGGQQQAVLVEQAPVHGVAGIDVLGDRVLHEVGGAMSGIFPDSHILFVDDPAHAAPVVAVGVRVDHGRDGKALADVLLEQLPRRARRFRCSPTGQKRSSPVLPRTNVMSERSKPRT